MGKLVDFRTRPSQRIATGVNRVGITEGEGKHMAADVLKLDANAMHEAVVPAGSDQYLFTLAGEASLIVDGTRHALGAGRFGILQEGRRYALAAGAAPAEVLSVLAPPAGSGTGLPGFAGGVKVMSKDEQPVADIPEAKKQRVYFVTHETCGSQRAHGMIVNYVPDTETSLHAHPDAESLFVFLEGTTRVTINGKESRVTPGQATFFPAGDRHGLHGDTGRSNFLEFHIPAGYTTVR